MGSCGYILDHVWMQDRSQKAWGSAVRSSLIAFQDLAVILDRSRDMGSNPYLRLHMKTLEQLQPLEC